MQKKKCQAVRFVPMRPSGWRRGGGPRKWPRVGLGAAPTERCSRIALPALPPAIMAAVPVFLSAASRDASLADELVAQLAPLTRAGRITLGRTAGVGAGEDWRAARDAALDQAALIVLLLSADYLVSD